MSHKPVKTFRITLSPLGAFFFGGENTFGGQGGDERNYFVRSNRFPQQTAILGMLRYAVLKNKPNLLPLTDYEGVKDWVGLSSFDPASTNADFGVIKHISPVFLQDEKNEAWIPQSADWGYWEKKKMDDPWPEHESGFPFLKKKVKAQCVLPLILQDNLKAETLTGLSGKTFAFQNALAVKNYDAKFGLAEWLVRHDGQAGLFTDFDEKEAPEGVFIAQEQVGITKAPWRKRRYGQWEEQEGFYKQLFYRLRAGWTFGIIVRLECDTDGSAPIPMTTTVFLGGERSAFQIQLEEITTDFESLFDKTTFRHPSGRNEPQIVLTSDAYLPEDFYRYCRYAIVETVDFRNMRTEQQPANFAQLNQGVTKSAQKRLLVRRGSVLFPDNTLTDATGSIVQLLTHQEQFRGIGYNQYIAYS